MTERGTDTIAGGDIYTGLFIGKLRKVSNKTRLIL